MEIGSPIKIAPPAKEAKAPLVNNGMGNSKIASAETTGVKINPAKNTVKTSIFYLNDLHAQFPEMREIRSEVDKFESDCSKEPNTDCFKLCAGDSFIGYEKSKNKLVTSFLDLIGIEYSAMGNHELDDIKGFSDDLHKMSTKFIVTNLNTHGETPLDEHIKSGKIARSAIVEKNGHKYGLIGTSPFSLNKYDKFKKANMSFDNYEQAKNEIQQEVNKLQEKGINKIIMLSHTGLANDKKFAQDITGIDVIIGGHSHDLVEGLRNKKNVFKSPDGSPVVITQAGKNGWYYGILDVVFDAKGKIKEATNNVSPTIKSPQSMVMEFFEHRFLGKPEHLGTVTKVDKVKGHYRTSENPYANFFCDAMKSELNADIAIMNSANIRGRAKLGEFSSLDLSSVAPFKNKLVKVQISEKTLINALNEGAQSLNHDMKKPGILQVSGMKYEIDDDGYVEKAAFINKQGQETPINTKNPSETKMYTVVYDSFILKGKEIPSLKTDNVLESYDFGKVKVAQDYIKNNNIKNIEFKLDNRIKVEED